jgi:2-amino-4-hydroxy-6-hydroxymethyldihydropteridine diphosphokinase
MTTDDGQRLAYICLGSNLGDRLANLSEAVDRIRQQGHVVVGSSSIYETEPVGLKDQAWFLNQVIAIDPTLARKASDKEVTAPQAKQLLDNLLEIEREMGRRRLIPCGPRLIDIDLLLLGDLVVGSSHEGDGLILPHPRLHLRRFVLEPLCEIAPDLMHPVEGRTCRQLLAGLEDRSRVTLFSAAVSV